MIKNKCAKFNKILIIRTGAIGDVVQTTNTFRAIKNANPNAQIDYLTGSATFKLLENDPDLVNVLQVKNKGYFSLLKMGFELKKNRYDLIINLQSSIRFKFLTFLINPKKVVIFKRNDRLHAVENYIEVAKKIMPELVCDKTLKLFLDKNLLEKIRTKFATDKKIVILNTQATRARFGRKWPIEYYIQLAKMLIEKYNCKIIIPGTEKDLLKVAIFANMHENVSVIAGQCSIDESAAVFACADLFISGDTGPLHVASATNGPVCIGIYGSTPILRCSTWGVKHHSISTNLDCVPCNKKRCRLQKDDFTPCMREIKPEHIMNLIEEYSLL